MVHQALADDRVFYAGRTVSGQRAPLHLSGIDIAHRYRRDAYDIQQHIERGNKGRSVSGPSPDTRVVVHVTLHARMTGDV